MDRQSLLEWLNRIGIILNFLAAFLLAPELIGLDRLRKLEKATESTLFYAYKKTESVINKFRIAAFGELSTTSQTINISKTVFLGMMVLFGVFLHFALVIIYPEYWVYIILSVVIWPWLITLIISLLISTFDKKRIPFWNWMKKVSANHNKIFSRSIIGGLFFFPYFPLYFIIIIMSITETIINSLIKQMELTDKLQAWIVGFGIAIFILGTLFQLIGTF